MTKLIYQEKENKTGKALYTVRTFYQKNKQVGFKEIYQIEPNGDKKRCIGIILDYCFLKGRIENEFFIDVISTKAGRITTYQDTALRIIRKDIAKQNIPIVVWEQDYMALNSAVHEVNSFGNKRTYNVLLSRHSGIPSIYVELLKMNNEDSSCKMQFYSYKSKTRV